jgi:hypothetical protein
MYVLLYFSSLRETHDGMEIMQAVSALSSVALSLNCMSFVSRSPPLLIYSSLNPSTFPITWQGQPISSLASFFYPCVISSEMGTRESKGGYFMSLRLSCFRQLLCFRGFIEGEGEIDGYEYTHVCTIPISKALHNMPQQTIQRALTTPCRLRADGQLVDSIFSTCASTKSLQWCPGQPTP